MKVSWGRHPGQVSDKSIASPILVMSSVAATGVETMRIIHLWRAPMAFLQPVPAAAFVLMAAGLCVSQVQIPWRSRRAKR